MSAKKRTKSSKNHTSSQNNKVLDSIPQAVKDEVEKRAREGKDILFKDPPLNKEIEKKQDILAEIAWQSFVKPDEIPKDKLKVVIQLYPLKRIDCLSPKKEKVRSEIKGYLDNSNIYPIDNPHNFHVLYIKNFKNFDNDILEDILRLQVKLEKATEYPIDLTTDEFGKIYSGQTLYYNSKKEQVTNNVKDHPIKIRQLENKAYVKCFSRSLIIISSLEGDKLPDWFKKQFEEISSSPEPKIEVGQQVEDVSQPKTEKAIKLRLVEEGSMVFWEDNPLTTIKGKDFDILLKLACYPMTIVIHYDLYKFIDSSEHEDELLRQRINYIRNAFPSPFSDYKHSQAIIKTKRMEGYYLNLTEKQVGIT